MERQEIKKGTRCNICTGCGRCFRGGEGVQVITGNGLQMEWQQEDGVSCERRNYLAAVDIGTTTIAMVLYDGKGEEADRFVTVNPQTAYGADVLSRIYEATSNEDASLDMKNSVLRVLQEGIERFRETVAKESAPEGKNPGGVLKGMSIAANTTMVYLLMGWDTRELGQAPFHASHLEPVETVIAGVPAVILPGLASFVGADITAGVYAVGMAEQEKVTLLVDLGTNGEMVIGGRNGMIGCSTAAGPAFEGGATKGIWGADMVSLTARLLREEIVDETGLMEDEYFDEGIRIGDVLVTQQAVRAIQLAKAAIASGIQTLVELYGLKGPEEVDQVVLAGGFGYYLKAEDAAEIGLIPEKVTDKVCSAGNTALAGALRYGRAMLCGEKQDALRVKEELKGIVEKTKIINLAETKGFNDRYIEAMCLERF